jgi:hypothetical protein
MRRGLRHVPVGRVGQGWADTHKRISVAPMQPGDRRVRPSCSVGDHVILMIADMLVEIVDDVPALGLVHLAHLVLTGCPVECRACTGAG